MQAAALVCVCVHRVYMRFTQEMQCQQQNKKGRCFLNGPPLSKQKTVMKEKKPNEAEKGSSH